MSVTVSIVDGPLAPPSPLPVPAGVGAAVIFDGIVRGLEDGRAIDALDYDAYEPMASKMLAALAADVLSRHQLIAMHVEHSRGRVPVGQVSFRLTVHSAHRREALAAMDEFIDWMKKDVPIWKMPVWRREP